MLCICERITLAHSVTGFSLYPKERFYLRT